MDKKLMEEDDSFMRGGSDMEEGSVLDQREGARIVTANCNNPDNSMMATKATDTKSIKIRMNQNQLYQNPKTVGNSKNVSAAPSESGRKVTVESQWYSSKQVLAKSAQKLRDEDQKIDYNDELLIELLMALKEEYQQIYLIENQNNAYVALTKLKQMMTL